MSALDAPLVRHPTGELLCAHCAKIVEHYSSWEDGHAIRWMVAPVEPLSLVPRWIVELKPCGHRFLTQAAFVLVAPEEP